MDRPPDRRVAFRAEVDGVVVAIAVSHEGVEVGEAGGRGGRQFSWAVAVLRVAEAELTVAVAPREPPRDQERYVFSWESRSPTGPAPPLE